MGRENPVPKRAKAVFAGAYQLTGDAVEADQLAIHLRRQRCAYPLLTRQAGLLALHLIEIAGAPDEIRTCDSAFGGPDSYLARRI